MLTRLCLRIQVGDQSGGAGIADTLSWRCISMPQNANTLVRYGPMCAMVSNMFSNVLRILSVMKFGVFYRWASLHQSRRTPRRNSAAISPATFQAWSMFFYTMLNSLKQLTSVSILFFESFGNFSPENIFASRVFSDLAQLRTSVKLLTLHTYVFILYTVLLYVP